MGEAAGHDVPEDEAEDGGGGGVEYQVESVAVEGGAPGFEAQLQQRQPYGARFQFVDVDAQPFSILPQ